MNHPAQFLDPFTQPGQFVFIDPVVLAIARLGVGFLELFEERPVGLPLARPGIDQPKVEAFGLGAQEAQIVDVGRLCRASDYAA